MRPVWRLRRATVTTRISPTSRTPGTGGPEVGGVGAGVELLAARVVDPHRGVVGAGEVGEVGLFDDQRVGDRVDDPHLRGEGRDGALHLAVEVVAHALRGEVADDHAEEHEDRQRQPGRDRGEPPADRPVPGAKRRPAGHQAFEHVPGAAFGVQEAGLVAFLELAAQVGDEDVDRVGRRHRVIAPDLVEQALARDDEALVVHQVLEQLELAVGQLDLALAALHLAGVGVERQVADLQRGRAARRPPPQQRPDPRQQLLALERLDQVVVGAAVEPADPVLGLGSRRQHQDRHVAVGAQPPADLDPVHARQPEVEHDQVRNEARGGVERLDPVAGSPHLVALVAQRAPQDVGDLLVVLDDQHPPADQVAPVRIRKHRNDVSPATAPPRMLLVRI